MNWLELKLKCAPPTGVRINLSGIEPSRLQSLTLEQIGRLSIEVDDKAAQLAEWFDIAGQPGDLQLAISGDLSCCDYIGAGLQIGQIKVEGNVGDFLGFNLAGGRIQLVGNAALFAGAAAKRGTILIYGSVGDYLAGTDSKSVPGLRGAEIVVVGNAGKFAGQRMRRGLLVIHGNVQTGLAMRMIAGTIVCSGTVGGIMGCGMKRGSILLLSNQEHRPRVEPGFTEPEETELAYLPILLRHIRPMLPVREQQSLGDTARQLPRKALRSLGDLGMGGLGELVIPFNQS